MEQVIRVAVLALLGSKNPAADCARLQRAQPVNPSSILAPGSRTVSTPGSSSVSTSGRRPPAKSTHPKPNLKKPNAIAATPKTTPIKPKIVKRSTEDTTTTTQVSTITPQTDVSATLQATAPQQISSTSAVIGRSFEDRVVGEMMPDLASRLEVKPAARLFRLTRQVARCGDLSIHYRGLVGFVELKNHARALPVIDRRRFFDSLLVNFRHLDWAILVTSRCSVPHFGEKGYTVVGRLVIDTPTASKNLPVAFVCGIDSLGVPALENAIRTMTESIINPSSSSLSVPRWIASSLVESGEASAEARPQWGKVEGASAFQHPPGAIF